ncbi:uncharacterized protein [Medicago truncatula]|uniref:uncharacterized protein n=1 Tax=Medicago truncatula TaxID=3880 RepID=UPI000D2F1C4C|nr:uncharacterized protein LOC25495099 [Medicago truncatula]XP_039682610.1 uncharacterized protein LOC25495099 [Medicago truncatula]
MKFLVESEGDLLLVDVYECIRTGFPDHDPVRIHVFKLNEKKLTSLGDKICTLDKIHVFCTWIKVDFHLCLILLNFPTCSGHLPSGSSKAEFDITMTSYYYEVSKLKVTMLMVLDIFFWVDKRSSGFFNSSL